MALCAGVMYFLRDLIGSFDCLTSALIEHSNYLGFKSKLLQREMYCGLLDEIIWKPLDEKYFVFLEPVKCHKKKIELGLEFEGENAFFKLSIISFFKSFLFR